MRRQSNLRHNLRVCILMLLFLIPHFLPHVKAQDSIPFLSAPLQPQPAVKPIRSLFSIADSIVFTPQAFPASFRNTRPNILRDDSGSLCGFFEQLRKVHAGLSDDTICILHVGDSHVRGRVFPRTADSLLCHAFGNIRYVQQGINGATCLTFTHAKRIEAMTKVRPSLLILSLGTNEAHNWRYNANAHYQQLDELVTLIRAALPGVPVLLTTPPGSYESKRRRGRQRTYSVNPRTETAAETICRYAASHGLAVWDLFSIAGGGSRACLNWQESGLMQSDHVHYLVPGYTLQGVLLYQSLIKAYNSYVLTH